MFHAIADIIEKYLGIPRDDVGGIMAIIGVIVLLYLWWRESRNKNKNKKWMNYCPIIYGSSWDWVGTEDLLENFKVDFILKSYKKCVNT